MNAPVHFKQTGIGLILSNANEHDPQYTYDAWDNDELLLGSRFHQPTRQAERSTTNRTTRRTLALHRGPALRLRAHPACATAAPRRPATATDRVSGTTGHYPCRSTSCNTLKRNFTSTARNSRCSMPSTRYPNLYVSVAKGYKAGGFNTQMFSRRAPAEDDEQNGVRDGLRRG